MQRAQRYFGGLGRDEDPDGRSRKHLRIALKRQDPMQEYVRLTRHLRAIRHILQETIQQQEDARIAGDEARFGDLTAALLRLQRRYRELQSELGRLRPAAFSHGRDHPYAPEFDPPVDDAGLYDMYMEDYEDNMRDTFSALTDQAAPVLSEEVRSPEYYRQEGLMPGFRNDDLRPDRSDGLMHRVTRNHGWQYRG